METILIEVGKEARIDFAFKGMEINLKNEEGIENRVIYLFFSNTCSINFEKRSKKFELKMSNGDKYIFKNFESHHFNRYLEQLINRT